MAPFTTHEFEKAQLGWTVSAGGLKIKIDECYTVYLPLVRGLHPLVRGLHPLVGYNDRIEWRLWKKHYISVNGYFTSRLDWQGNPHHQSFSDLELANPNVGPGHLASLAAWIQAQERPGLPGPRSLLSLPHPKPAAPRLLPALKLLTNRSFGVRSRDRPSHGRDSVYRCHLQSLSPRKI